MPKNIFLERAKVREHRSLPKEKGYKEFVKKLPRGGYQTYVAQCEQKGKQVKLKEGMYYYYKHAMKAEVGSRAPSKKPNTYKGTTAKEWYEELYKKYDLVVHLDGKSLEDQERVWRNPKLKMRYKWISLAVEAKSGVIVGAWLEQSHTKSNALMMIKEICRCIKISIGKKKIIFITDAGSEYLNDKKLRGIEVTDLDTSGIVKYLREEEHSLRITRMPQDNGFVENKNDYIERACLDDKAVMSMEPKEFVEQVEKFVQMNNQYLRGSKKSFRGKGVTPLENIQGRFGKEKGRKWIGGIHSYPIEKLMRLPSEYEKQSLCELMPRVAKCYLRDSIWIRKHLKLTKHSPLHPKSLDSSICQNIITGHRKYKYV